MSDSVWSPQAAACQAPLSLGFSRQEYWNGLPFPSPMHACTLSRFSHVWHCVILWTAALQAPLSTGFSRQENWSGLPFPSPIPLQLLFYHFMLGSHHVSNYYLTRLFLTRLSAHYDSTYNSIYRLSPRVIFLKLKLVCVY